MAEIGWQRELGTGGPTGLPHTFVESTALSSQCPNTARPRAGQGEEQEVGKEKLPPPLSSQGSEHHRGSCLLEEHVVEPPSLGNVTKKL